MQLFVGDSVSLTIGTSDNTLAAKKLSNEIKIVWDVQHLIAKATPNNEKVRSVSLLFKYACTCEKNVLKNI